MNKLNGKLSFVARPQAIRALTDAVTVERFVKHAKRVITFARWVMDACFIVNLLRVKSALHRKVCRCLHVNIVCTAGATALVVLVQHVAISAAAIAFRRLLRGPIPMLLAAHRVVCTRVTTGC